MSGLFESYLNWLGNRNKYICFCFTRLIRFHVKHFQQSQTEEASNILLFFPNMKKTLFIILFLTVYSLALNCINLATYGMIYTLPNARPDSSFTDTLRKSVIVEERKEITIPYYMSKKIIWNGNTIEKIVDYDGNNIDSLKTSKISNKAITIQQDGDEISINSNIEEITYISKDSSYHTFSDNGYKNGSYYRSKNTETRFIRNDTLFIKNYFSETSDKSGTYITDRYFIVHDPDNKDQCIEKKYYINEDKTISVSDKIRNVYTIEETANGFVTTRKSLSSSSSYKVFYVYNNESTISLKKNIHPTIIPKGIQLFDLLGRPANSKHIIKVNR